MLSELISKENKPMKKYFECNKDSTYNANGELVIPLTAFVI